MLRGICRMIIGASTVLRKEIHALSGKIIISLKELKLFLCTKFLIYVIGMIFLSCLVLTSGNSFNIIPCFKKTVKFYVSQQHSEIIHSK